MEQNTRDRLKKVATQIRLDILRGVHAASSGHPGGSLSISDILAYLYFEKMNVDPKNPKDENRDRLVLSKGHTAPALYAALAAKGFFDPAEIDREMDNAYLQIAREIARVPFGAEVAVGYVIGVEYAVKNLRILLVAKETGADGAVLGGRLRENYV